MAENTQLKLNDKTFAYREMSDDRCGYIDS